MLRQVSYALMFFAIFASIANAQEKRSKCWETAMTTPAMHQCADEDARAADAELNKTFQSLLDKAKNQPKAVDKLKKAERAWVVYRDAQLEAIFPSDKKQTVYGSMFPTCYLKISTAITKQRTSELRRMLDAWEQEGGEGAGCYYRIGDSCR